MTFAEIGLAPAGLENGLQAKWSATEGTWKYYFCAATQEDRAAGWTGPTVLGCDRAKAQATANVLFADLQRLRSGVSDVHLPTYLTYDWMLSEYTKCRRFLGEEGEYGAALVVEENGEVRRVLREKHKNRLWHLRLISNYELQDGRRVGDLPLKEINPNLIEGLYRNLRYTTKWDPDLQQRVAVERITTRGKAFTYSRSMWNEIARLHGDVVPTNPFSNMKIRFDYKDFPAASYEELQAFIEAADGKGHPSIANAALVGWEWAQRKEHLLQELGVEDYRPENAPNYVFVQHPKTEESVWMPLVDPDNGTPLFTELVARLDEAVAGRTTGPVIIQDDVYRETGRIEGWTSLKRFNSLVKEIIKEAGIRECLSFASFRQGGLTECGDAELTDAEIRHISRHKNVRVLRRYIKRTARAISNAQRKRETFRELPKAGPDAILVNELRRPPRGMA